MTDGEGPGPSDSTPPAPRDPRRTWAIRIGLGVVALVLLGVIVANLSHEEPELAGGTNVALTTTSTTKSAPPSTTEAPTTAAPTTAPSTTPGAEPATALSPRPVRTTEVATVARGTGSIPVYPSSTAGEADQRIDVLGEYGQRQVFLVVDRDGDRLEVLLPIRPNGSRGWINAADVTVASHDYQIQVSLSGYRMMVQRGDEVVIDTAIGVGTSDTPTVGGDFYTWVLIDPTNTGYGSYAYGLSGFSTLEQFAGGDGRMGIHGTTDDGSIGRNVSHGCVRVPDDVVVRMVEDVGLPLGVPVAILA